MVFFSGFFDDLSVFDRRSRRCWQRSDSLGTGATCGSLAINFRFEEYVRDKLGHEKFDAIWKEKPRNWQVAMRSFEYHVKASLEANVHQTFEIPFPLDKGETPHVVDGLLRVTSTEIEKMFRPAVDEALELAFDQVHRLHSKGKSVEGIILVGGFGPSGYLYHKVKARAVELCPHPRVLQPPHAWTATVRGAVLRQIEGTDLVLSRRARRNYVVRCTTRFDPSKHSKSRKLRDEYDETWLANNRVLWYIGKGQISFYLNVGHEEEKEKKKKKKKKKKEKKEKKETEVVVCDDDDPPDMFISGPKSPTRVLCTSTTNPHPVPGHLWQQRSTSKGQAYQRLDFDVGMHIESGGLRFDCRVDDVVDGKVTASFE